ncbi:hypothetical protein PIROE2DRAFT_3696 [Piromyces sp. E2]|nr:hypothetical protein PIROE2DRAFT_3696 [Piromyces sp. E2]|eukprot:OUM68558.1 hypothetical protein PIROE2DRAFT_3696 [Piromyces sp. E2]
MKNLKSSRREEIDKFLEITSKKEPLFSNESDVILRDKFKKHFLENIEYQYKQAEESRKLREKEKEENRQFYYEKGVRAYNELKEEEAKCAEKEKLMNLELTRFNIQLMKEKKKRDLENNNDILSQKLEEEKNKDDNEFNDYVLKCINELEMNGRDTRNLYSSLITEKPKISQLDIDYMPDTFRRLGINGIHNADEDIVSYLQNTKNN